MHAQPFIELKASSWLSPVGFECLRFSAAATESPISAQREAFLHLGISRIATI
jgi:hypothetical protein